MAEEAVARAAGMIRHRSPGPLTTKGERDFATQLDYEIEREIRAFLRSANPEIGFLGEEGGVQSTGVLQWVLDPIDGTANFVRGVPLCAVSLGLLHGDDAVLGVIEAPFLGNRYAAARGNGATVDGKPIRVSNTTRLSDAIVAIGDYAVGEDAAARNQPRLALTARLAETVQRVRMIGTAALDLAWLAKGRIDAALTLSNHPWDMTGGTAIAREAGAVVIDHDGSAHHPGSSVTLGITPGLAEQVRALVGANAHERTRRSAPPSHPKPSAPAESAPRTRAQVTL
ncbi:inositol monophosphatase family protein [Micromonospora sp. NPDC051925]|uniref:inositol monophosphatase family protein n=1 Tax=Micromonospora sp. NPDC051925 TaxID=3364288 RepID=UPI0037C99E56